MTERQRRRPGGGRKAEHRDSGHDFGRWLAAAIRERGINQAVFAERVGASETTVSRWINRRVPDGAFIGPIAQVLMLDYDYVAGLAGYRPQGAPALDPETPEGRIVPLVRRIAWTPERLRIVLAVLGAMAGPGAE